MRADRMVGMGAGTSGAAGTAGWLGLPIAPTRSVKLPGQRRPSRYSWAPMRPHWPGSITPP
ncbi:hypothetical protein MMMB2_1031 [Mycobacterium marinum MB2]|nr:hypothetical protein MMMB2_1031 [Mycobacterium marinum MB2]